MVDEGLLSHNHAELFIEDIVADFRSIDNQVLNPMMQVLLCIQIDR